MRVHAGRTPDAVLMTNAEAEDRIGFVIDSEEEREDPRPQLVRVDWGNGEAWHIDATADEVFALAAELHRLGGQIQRHEAAA